MATEGILGSGIDIGGIAGSAATGFVSILITLVYVVVGAAIILFVIYYLRHDYDVRVRFQTREGSIIQNRRGRVVDTGSRKVLKLFMSKIKVNSAPEKECIDFTKRGRKVVDVIVDEKGDSRFIKVRGFHDAPEFVALDANERAAYVEEQEKIARRKQRGVLDLIRDIAPIFAVVTIFILLIIFWGDIVAPIERVGGLMIEGTKENNRMYSEFARWCRNEQVIVTPEVDVNATEGEPPE